MNKQQAWHQGWPIFVEKIGGPGSGWFGPPRGTHTSVVTGKTAAQMRTELKRDYKRKMDRMRQLREQADQIDKKIAPLAYKRRDTEQELSIAKHEGRTADVKKLKAELHSIDQETNKSLRGLAKIETEHGKVLQSIREGAREKLKVANPAEFDTYMGRLRKGREDLQKGSDVFASMMGRGTLDGATVAVHTTKGNRGHYDNNGVYLPPMNRRSKVMVHELGHWLEDRDGDVHAKALAFLKKRTKGEQAITLRKATGNPGYRANEMTKKDKFMDPYSGKQYSGGRATEIVSMGIEHFYSEPIEFATRDPSYFDFMYDLLRGE